QRDREPGPPGPRLADGRSPLHASRRSRPACHGAAAQGDEAVPGRGGMKALHAGRFVLLSTLLFLYAPIGVLVLYSFNASRFGARWTGFTGEWYARLLESPETIAALWNTLIVSTASTLLATVLGTLLAIGMHVHRARGRPFLELLIYLPVIVPDIVMGVATLALYVTAGFPLGRASIILAHVAFQISFVTLVVRGRL